MRRREFITLLGGAAAAWPLAARAEQSVMPVIGLLSGGTLEDDAFRVNAVGQVSAETGFDEGRDGAFESRGGGGRCAQLPALAADLVRTKGAVIASLGPTLSALAAKAASAGSWS